MSTISLPDFVCTRERPQQHTGLFDTFTPNRSQTKKNIHKKANFFVNPDKLITETLCPRESRGS